ncbi:hypothetical protein ACYX79_11675 [Stenotrophomonas rhizophila]
MRAAFTARLGVARARKGAAVRTLRHDAARAQVAARLAAIGASAQHSATFFRARHDEVKKVSSECVILSAIVHLQRFLRFQMKVKILKSH